MLQRGQFNPFIPRCQKRRRKPSTIILCITIKGKIQAEWRRTENRDGEEGRRGGAEGGGGAGGGEGVGGEIWWHKISVKEKCPTCSGRLAYTNV